MMPRNVAPFFTVLFMSTCINAFAPTSLFGSKRGYDSSIAALMLDGQEIRGPITPLGNFVLVRTKDTLSSTGGGILLPDQVRTLLLSSMQKYF